MDLEVDYSRGIKNSHRDALSRLPTTAGKQTRIDDTILCYYVQPKPYEDADESTLNEPVQVRHECVTSTSAEVSRTAISTEVFLREQDTDPFCNDMLSRLKERASSEANALCWAPTDFLSEKQNSMDLFNSSHQSHEGTISSALLPFLLQLVPPWSSDASHSSPNGLLAINGTRDVRCCSW